MREIMTDNGREMRAICEQEGIKLHTSVRYTPESNGVVERTIGLLTDTVPPQIPVGGSVQHRDIRT